MNWTTMTPEDLGEPGQVEPLPREHCSMIYDDKGRRILCFGGWNNEWYSDLYALNVSKIVGPSYAITEIVPNLGQVSGTSHVTVKGCGFRDASIRVFFTLRQAACRSAHQAEQRGGRSVPVRHDAHLRDAFLRRVRPQRVHRVAADPGR